MQRSYKTVKSFERFLKGKKRQPIFWSDFRRLEAHKPPEANAGELWAKVLGRRGRHRELLERERQRTRSAVSAPCCGEPLASAAANSPASQTLGVGAAPLNLREQNRRREGRGGSPKLTLGWALISERAPVSPGIGSPHRKPTRPFVIPYSQWTRCTRAAGPIKTGLGSITNLFFSFKI